MKYAVVCNDDNIVEAIFDDYASAGLFRADFLFPQDFRVEEYENDAFVPGDEFDWELANSAVAQKGVI